MGVYNKAEGTHNQKPYYVNDRKNWYFFSDRGFWGMDTKLGAVYWNIRPTHRITQIWDQLLPIGALGWEYTKEYTNGKPACSVHCRVRNSNYIRDPKITVAILGIRGSRL